ncbi:MAG: barstar family protein [Wenzhouxiangella sp.]|nr:barstar family protein [Wenzhouxiangella sp.]
MSGPPCWRQRLHDWLADEAPLLLLPAAEAARQLPTLLEAAGFTPRVVDFSEIVDKRSLMAAMRDALGLDAWFGANWDALADALHGPETPVERRYVLVLQVPPSGLRLADADFIMLLEIIGDVAGSERSCLRGAVVVGAPDGAGRIEGAS